MESMVQQIWMKLFALLNIWPTHTEMIISSSHDIVVTESALKCFEATYGIPMGKPPIDFHHSLKSFTIPPLQIFMKGHEPWCSEDPLKFRCRTDEKNPGEIKCGGKFKHLQTFCYSNYIFAWLLKFGAKNSPRPSRFSPENDVPK